MCRADAGARAGAKMRGGRCQRVQPEPGQRSYSHIVGYNTCMLYCCTHPPQSNSDVNCHNNTMSSSTSHSDIKEKQPGKTWTVLNEDDGAFNITLPLGFGRLSQRRIL